MPPQVYDLRLNRLHPKQQAIFDHPARFRVLACGRRFGKTEFAVHELIQRAIRGQSVAYFAPGYKMTSEVWRMLLWRLGRLVVKGNKTEGRIELVTKGVIEVWSLSTASAETVRGRKFHFVVIDEAAMVVNGMNVWNEVIRPLLVDYAGGALFCSTPKGRNWFWEMFSLGLDPLKQDYACWNHPTTDNPYISPEEVENARGTTVERSFNQEYLAQFVEDAGEVFRGVALISTLTPLDAPIQAHRYIMGCDWGRDLDFTSICIMDELTHEQVALERFNKVGYELQKGRVQALYEHWGVRVAICEENSMGAPIVEALQAAGLNVEPFYTTAASKKLIIEDLALGIERKDMLLLADALQKHELQSYTMGRSPGGNITYGAPQGGHDDTVISLALCWYGVLHSSPIVMRQMATRW